MRILCVCSKAGIEVLLRNVDSIEHHLSLYADVLTDLNIDRLKAHIHALEEPQTVSRRTCIEKQHSSGALDVCDSQSSSSKGTYRQWTCRERTASTINSRTLSSLHATRARLEPPTSADIFTRSDRCSGAMQSVS